MRPQAPKFVSALLALSLLGGCADAKLGQTGGAILGGIGGGLLGSQFGGGIGRVLMTSLGAALGAYAGSELGKKLDKADKEEVLKAEEKAQDGPVGETIAWSNPQSGNSGTVTPVSENTDAQGRTCRDYQSTITVDGKDETVTGTACKQADGSWSAVN
ncbi:RT0821/Lpp0805 family surface protein [Paramagnetospirillum magneticum]|uniref:Surface antigen n=1 Tax=Paramagnetospirillum magneticum (strain ATCC 700264 / AMB-1) TaxID=342108 RepID=Q2W8Y4_PARM1|nr:RT0821/Lpp0805 family surface protein [Paramagnetospirillum magneticum]BAE49691.1 Surface antigen [Paramagnetospirillum magneticum AMB-1]